MVTLKTKKFNLIHGTLDSGKTSLLLNIANDYLDEKGEVIIVTLDNNVDMIKQVIHCLYNDVHLINVKYEKDDKTPIGLELPNNLSIIDDTYLLNNIKSTIVELCRSTKPSIILIDCINFCSDFSNLSYKEKLESLFLELDSMAQLFDCPVVGTMNTLGISDLKEDFFKLKDSTSIKIVRKKDVEFEIKECKCTEKVNFIDSKSISMNFKNIKMSEIDVSALVDSGVYD